MDLVQKLTSQISSFVLEHFDLLLQIQFIEAVWPQSATVLLLQHALGLSLSLRWNAATIMSTRRCEFK